MDNTKKQIKALISGLLAEDTQKVNRLVGELSESIIQRKEKVIMEMITKSLRGDTHV